MKIYRLIYYVLFAVGLIGSVACESGTNLRGLNSVDKLIDNKTPDDPVLAEQREKAEEVIEASGNTIGASEVAPPPIEVIQKPIKVVFDDGVGNITYDDGSSQGQNDDYIISLVRGNEAPLVCDGNESGVETIDGNKFSDYAWKPNRRYAVSVCWVKDYSSSGGFRAFGTAAFVSPAVVPEVLRAEIEKAEEGSITIVFDAMKMPLKTEYAVLLQEAGKKGWLNIKEKLIYPEDKIQWSDLVDEEKTDSGPNKTIASTDGFTRFSLVILRNTEMKIQIKARNSQKIETDFSEIYTFILPEGSEKIQEIDLKNPSLESLSNSNEKNSETEVVGSNTKLDPTAEAKTAEASLEEQITTATDDLNKLKETQKMLSALESPTKEQAEQLAAVQTEISSAKTAISSLETKQLEEKRKILVETKATTPVAEPVVVKTADPVVAKTTEKVVETKSEVSVQNSSISSVTPEPSPKPKSSGEAEKTAKTSTSAEKVVTASTNSSEIEEIRAEARRKHAAKEKKSNREKEKKDKDHNNHKGKKDKHDDKKEKHGGKKEKDHEKKEKKDKKENSDRHHDKDDHKKKHHDDDDDDDDDYDDDHKKNKSEKKDDKKRKH